MRMGFLTWKIFCSLSSFLVILYLSLAPSLSTSRDSEIFSHLTVQQAPDPLDDSPSHDVENCEGSADFDDHEALLVCNKPLKILLQDESLVSFLTHSPALVFPTPVDRPPWA